MPVRVDPENEIDELLKVAESVRGSWMIQERYTHTKHGPKRDDDRMIVNVDDESSVAWCGHGNKAKAEQIANYIETFDPDTMVNILNRLKDAELQRDILAQGIQCLKQGK